MKKINTETKILALISLLLIIVFILYPITVRYYYPDMQNRGFFGDMFGGINALFSGLAFLGVIYTIILQRKELQLQRKELELTRKELERTARAQEKSEEALSRQAESLKATAKLNGLSAKLQYQGILLETLATGKYALDRETKDQAEATLKQIDDIIAKK